MAENSGNGDAREAAKNREGIRGNDKCAILLALHREALVDARHENTVGLATYAVTATMLVFLASFGYNFLSTHNLDPDRRLVFTLFIGGFGTAIAFCSTWLVVRCNVHAYKFREIASNVEAALSRTWQNPVQGFPSSIAELSMKTERGRLVDGFDITNNREQIIVLIMHALALAIWWLFWLVFMPS